jgi:hypothetical protein
MVGGRTRRKWVPVTEQVTTVDEATQAVTTEVHKRHKLVTDGDPRPSMSRVNPWHFFPETEATSIEDSEGIFERHLLSRTQLKARVKADDYDEAAVARLLREDPRDAAPNYLTQLRTIINEESGNSSRRYHVWEYHGPIDTQDLRGIAVGSDRVADFGSLDSDKTNVCLIFCQDELLKVDPYPLDSGECLYSVWTLEKDDASIFGYGLPYILRHPQKALNAAWRMMLDNAGLSTGPQIVINTEQIEPADGSGDYTLAPRKVWRRKGGTPNVPAFEVYNIDSHQAELAGIIEMASAFIDQDSNMPMVAQGEQGTNVTQTAHGMSLLMNSANVVFRRLIKNWDDDITTPCIRRMYDWNMQFSPKEYIKGDYEVDARGTSVLLLRELTAANLMSVAMNLTVHPVIGPLLKPEPLTRKLMQANMLSADELVLTDAEIEAKKAEAAQQPAPPEPHVLAAETEMNKINLANENAKELALIDRETKLMLSAQTGNVKLDEIGQKDRATKVKVDSDERKMAVEAAVTQRQMAAKQPTGGGNF